MRRDTWVCISTCWSDLLHRDCAAFKVDCIVYYLRKYYMCVFFDTVEIFWSAQLLRPSCSSFGQLNVWLNWSVFGSGGLIWSPFTPFCLCRFRKWWALLMDGHGRGGQNTYVTACIGIFERARFSFLLLYRYIIAEDHFNLFQNLISSYIAK